MAKPRTFSKYHVRVDAKGKKDRTYIDLKSGKEVIADSLMEKQFYMENILPAMESGELIDYEAQKKYLIQPSFKHNGKTIRAIDYVCDYWVKYADGREQVYDVKGGLVDAVALLKKKLVHYRYPDLDYQWTTRTKDGWFEYDEWKKNKRQTKKTKQQKEKEGNK